MLFKWVHVCFLAHSTCLRTASLLRRRRPFRLFHCKANNVNKIGPLCRSDQLTLCVCREYVSSGRIRRTPHMLSSFSRVSFPNVRQWSSRDSHNCFWVFGRRPEPNHWVLSALVQPDPSGRPAAPLSVSHRFSVILLERGRLGTATLELESVMDRFDTASQS